MDRRGTRDGDPRPIESEVGPELRADRRVERQPHHFRGERHVLLRLELAGAGERKRQYVRAARPRTPLIPATRDSTPSRIFSHTRGTAKKIVGRQSGKSSATVEIERANQSRHRMR